MTTEITPSNDRELVLTRLVDVPAEKLYRCWTEPDLLTQWFAPAPWTTPSATLDVRAGGASLGTMRSPEGDTTRYTARAARDQGGHGAARGHGLPRGLGRLHRPIGGAGEDPLIP